MVILGLYVLKNDAKKPWPFHKGVVWVAAWHRRLQNLFFKQKARWKDYRFSTGSCRKRRKENALRSKLKKMASSYIVPLGRKLDATCVSYYNLGHHQTGQLGQSMSLSSLKDSLVNMALDRNTGTSVQLLAQPQTNCVTLGKSFHLPLFLVTSWKKRPIAHYITGEQGGEKSINEHEILRW